MIIEFLLSPIALLGALAILVFGCYSDAQSSKDFIYFGLQEKNYARDRNGDFSLKKYVIAFSVIAGVMAAVNLFAAAPIAKGFSTLAVAAIGGMAYLFSVLNNQKKPKMRALQESTLANRDWYGMTFITQPDGKGFYGLFRWIYSTNPDVKSAIREVNTQLDNFAANPKFPV